MADTSEDRAVVLRAAEKHRVSEALDRRARLAAATSRVFQVLAALAVALGLLSKPWATSPSLEYGPSTEERRLRAQEVEEAWLEAGKGLALLTIGALSLGSTILAVRFARRWARAASESIASSEGENRQVLQVTRTARLPFALFLRGFREEGKSLDSLSFLPFSTRRVDKATRWIESEVVDELQRRDRRVFCIANPSDRFLLPGAIRLEANREHWLSEVGAMATECEVIVVYLSETSPGLLAELDLLRRRNLVGKTLVVMGWRVRRQEPLVGDFPIVVVAPPASKFNQSAFGPVVGRSRFRRELSASIEKLITC